MIRTKAEKDLEALFDHVEQTGERGQAISVLLEKGLPSKRVEAWKYTDLRAQLKNFAPVTLGESGLEASFFKTLDTLCLTFDQGTLVGVLPQMPKGLRVKKISGADALAFDEAWLEKLHDKTILNLNTAFVNEAVLIEVEEGAHIEQPLWLGFVGQGFGASFARVYVHVGAGAHLKLFESFEHNGAHTHNSVLRLEVAAGAVCEHVRVCVDEIEANHFALLALKLNDSSQYKRYALNAGSQLARTDIYAHFAGEHASLKLSGATLLDGARHSDCTFFTDHATPHGTSQELQKNVVFDEATGVFQGKVLVRPDAQKTDGKMMCQTLLLSEGAHMYAKPELEIYADDVVCGHGATCGALDEEQMFYLMARGLPKAQAQALLLRAFVDEAFADLEEDAELYELLTHCAHVWLQKR